MEQKLTHCNYPCWITPLPSPFDLVSICRVYHPLTHIPLEPRDSSGARAWVWGVPSPPLSKPNTGTARRECGHSDRSFYTVSDHNPPHVSSPFVHRILNIPMGSERPCVFWTHRLYTSRMLWLGSTTTLFTHSELYRLRCLRTVYWEPHQNSMRESSGEKYHNEELHNCALRQILLAWLN
jgi:hypothetical protein